MPGKGDVQNFAIYAVPINAAAWFCFQASLVGFVVDIVTLGQCLSTHVGLSVQLSFHQCSILIHLRCDNPVVLVKSQNYTADEVKTQLLSLLLLLLLLLLLQRNLPKPDPLYTGNLDKRKINSGTELFPM